MVTDCTGLARLGHRARLGALALGLCGAACKKEETRAPDPPPAGMASGPVTDAPSSPPLEDPQAPRTRPPPEPVSDLAGALTALATGNPEGAATFLDAYVATTPNELEGRLALAQALTQTGRYDQAMKTLTDARGASPRLLLATARLAWRLGDLARTETVLTQLVARDKDAILARGLLLGLRLDRGRADDPKSRALMEDLYDAYDAGLAKTPHDLYGVALAALTRGGTGAFQDANMVLEDAEQAAPLKPGSFIAEDILLLRGSMFLQKYATDDAADRMLARAVKLVPRDPHVQSAYGLNALRIGDENRGLEALRSAWKRDRFNERTDNVLKLYEERIDTTYSETTVGDLTIRLPTLDRELIEPRLLESIQRARKALDAAYGMKVGPLRLEFFSSPDEFSVRTVGVPSLGAAAVCFGEVITFVGPYLGSHNLDGVIWHELAHVYAIEKSQSRVPRWFTEGLSEWESELADPAFARESAELLKAAHRQGRLRKLSELELAFIRAESPQMMEVAYSLAAYAMRYLGETYGRTKLIRMLEGYASGKHTRELVRIHLGTELSALEREFDAWLTLQLGKAVQGWSPSPGPPHEMDDHNRLYLEALELIQRHKYKDAVTKLEELVAGGADGYIPRLMLGRVLVRLDKPKDAAKHLHRARVLYPESIDPLVVLIEIAHAAGDVPAEMKHLREALAIDANGLGPAARLLMLAVVTGNKKDRQLAQLRASAIAPLHPIVLAAQALQLGQAGQGKAGRPYLVRALQSLGKSQGPADTFVVAALAAAALGEKDQAAVLAARARQDPKLPKPAIEALKSR